MAQISFAFEASLKNASIRASWSLIMAWASSNTTNHALLTAADAVTPPTEHLIQQVTATEPTTSSASAVTAAVTTTASSSSSLTVDHLNQHGTTTAALVLFKPMNAMPFAAVMVILLMPIIVLGLVMSVRFLKRRVWRRPKKAAEEGVVEEEEEEEEHGMEKMVKAEAKDTPSSSLSQRTDSTDSLQQLYCGYWS